MCKKKAIKKIIKTSFRFDSMIIMLNVALCALRAPLVFQISSGSPDGLEKGVILLGV